MGLGTFAAGPYNVQWKIGAGAAANLGLFKGGRESPAIRFNHKIQRIDSTNNFGETVIGGIYLGRDCRFQGVFEEWSALVRGVLFPFGTDFALLGPLGVDTYDLAQTLILTAATGSLSAANGPATLTANKAVLCADFPFDVLFGPPLRETPIAMDLLPYESTPGAGYRNFTFT